MSAKAFDKAASPIVDALLDAVQKRVCDELRATGRPVHPAIVLAITLGIAEAVPFIAQLTKAYIENSNKEEK